MNILVISLPDLKRIPPQRPHHLLKHLSQKHKVTVLCVNAWWLEERQDEYLKESLKNINIHYIAENKLNPVCQEILATRRLRGLRDTFDCVVSLNSLLASYFVVKEVQIPSVFDICDDIISWIGTSPQIPTFLKPIGKLAGSFILQRNINISRQVTYSTEILKQSYKLPDDKSILIPNGVDTNLFYRRNRKIRDRLNISDDEFVLGFVGFLGQWINLETVFKTIRMLQDQIKIKMVIVGDGNKLLTYKSLSEKYGIQKNVIFTGGVPYLDVPEYISCMDICLLPFDRSAVSQSALPFKLLEYMACERPVISSPILGAKNAVGDMVFYASNQYELTQSILKLYYDEELRIKLGKRGREFVNQNYNWDKICNKFEKVLIEAAESKG